jgi:hypothetical protein
VAKFHVGGEIEHWLELWADIGTEFLRLQNVPTLYVLQNCRRVLEENCRNYEATLRSRVLLQNCYNCYIKRDGAELV